LSVLIGDEHYDKDAGVGWILVDDDTVDFNTLKLSKSKVLYKQDYKLIVVYNSTITAEASLTVENYLSEYDCDIEQTTL
jgi:hypothetical protein